MLARHDVEVHHLRVEGGAARRPHRDRRRALHLPAATDDGAVGGADQRAGCEHGAQHAHHVLGRPREVRRHEEEHDVGGLALELLEDLPRDLADGVRGDRVLRHRSGVPGHDSRR